MKRIMALCLMAILLCSLTACRFNYMDSDKIHAFFSDLAENFGRSQITDDDNLIGERTTNDAYTGSYQSDCNGSTGRDVVFGGGSIEENILYVSGRIHTESGKATIRIRMNDEVTELSVDENGYFETELSLSSGGNYIMVQYEDFEGTVELESKYKEAAVS